MNRHRLAPNKTSGSSRLHQRGTPPCRVGDRSGRLRYAWRSMRRRPRQIPLPRGRRNFRRARVLLRSRRSSLQIEGAALIVQRRVADAVSQTAFCGGVRGGARRRLAGRDDHRGQQPPYECHAFGGAGSMGSPSGVRRPKLCSRVSVINAFTMRSQHHDHALQLARDTRNPRRNSSLSLSNAGGAGGVRGTPRRN